MPLACIAALGFLTYFCLGAQAFLGRTCISVQCSCSQSICQLPIVLCVLHLTFFPPLQHPTAWGHRVKGPHPRRASCLTCWHLKLGPQGVFLLCVSWLQLG